MPAWVRRALLHFLSADEVEAVLEELAELHAAWAESRGRPEADRRYLRQLRQYPFRLLLDRVRRLPGAPVPGLREVRQAARSLFRAPGLTGAIVLSVGLGIGGCTAVFAIVDALYLRALPYPEAERLYWIYTDSPPNRWPFSVVDLDALSEGQSSFAGVAAYARSAPTLRVGDQAERVSALRVTPGFFDLLGIRLASGRAVTEADTDPGAAATVVVTRGFAERRLGSVDPGGSDVLGRLLELDGETVEIVGVLPPTSDPLTRGVEVFPTLQVESPARKGPFFLTVFGRLQDGVAPETAREELRRLNEELFPFWVDSYQDSRASWGMMTVPRLLQGDVSRLLLVLTGAVGLLLLIAAANATNLLLSRLLARRRELAVREALGASRGRIRAHLLTESGVLSLGGVLVGLALAQATLGVLPTLAGDYLPRLEEARLSGTTLAFALTLSAACMLLFGLVPAVGSGAAASPGAALRSGGRTATRGVGAQGKQRALVASQFAITVPLLVGAGLLLTSFARLAGRDPGFQPEGWVSARLSLPAGSYPDGEARKRFWDELTERIATLPGVQSVGLSSARPGEVFSGSNNFDLEDHPTPPGQSQPAVPWLFAETGYFETLGVPLLEGRWLEPADELSVEPVVMVDAAWARRFFPGASAVGRRMRSGGQTDGPWTTVVGVVGEVSYSEPGSEGVGVVYMPDPRRIASAPFLHVRTSGRPDLLLARIRDEVRDADPGLPLSSVATGEAVLEASLARPRHLTLLLGAFAVVALGLSVVGLYGILAQAVQGRRADIAVRLALGGEPRAVLAMVLRQGLALAGLGVAVGLLGAVVLGRVLDGLLYGVSSRDPGVLGGAAVCMLAMAGVACLVPGRRAVRVDPAATLREE